MHSLGSIGFFTARAFLTAFVTAVLLRYAQEYPTGWLAQHFAAVQGAPTWFTHDGTILVLGVLAVVGAGPAAKKGRPDGESGQARLRDRKRVRGRARLRLIFGLDAAPDARGRNYSRLPVVIGVNRLPRLNLPREIS